MCSEEYFRPGRLVDFVALESARVRAGGSLPLMARRGIAMGTDADNELLRRIEQEVLDQHRRQCGLLARHENVAVEVLLRCYAQILRDLRTGKIPKPSDDAKSQTANEGLRGLGHCLRWIRECCPSRLVVPSATPYVLAREALELLQWGVAYDPIWNEHSAYSRRLVNTEVDQRNKVITFLPRRDVNPRFFVTQIEAKKADDQRRAADRPDAQLAERARTWCDSVRVSGQGLRFDDATIPYSGAVDVAALWMEKTCLPELDGGTSLKACTVDELRRVLATLYVHSLFVTKLEDVSDDQPVCGVVLRPCVMARQRDQMINWLAALSRVPAKSAEAILSVLTFDPTHPHVTLAQQPFVNSADGQLFYLPRMLLLLDLPCMYIGALNKDRQGNTVYAERINEVEAAGVKAIGEEIRAAVPNTLQMATKFSFRLPDGGKIVPDMVLVSEADHTVLVVDVKYATPPFGPADVHYDMKEMEKWKNRVLEYVTTFETNPSVLTQTFQWECQGTPAVFGLILLRWPLPIPVEFPDSVSAVDWPSLSEYFSHGRFASIRDLMTWACNRPDITAPKALTWKAKEVRVAEWTYRYFVLTPLPNDKLFDRTQKLAYRLWEQRGKPLWDDLRDWYLAEEQMTARRWVALDTDD